MVNLSKKDRQTIFLFTIPMRLSKSVSNVAGGPNRPDSLPCREARIPLPYLGGALPYSRAQAVHQVFYTRKRNNFQQFPPCRPGGIGRHGDDRTRTGNPSVANAVLSQLSYVPEASVRFPARDGRWQIFKPPAAGNRGPMIGNGPGWSRTNDLTLIRGAL